MIMITVPLLKTTPFPQVRIFARTFLHETLHFLKNCSSDFLTESSIKGDYSSSFCVLV